MRLSEGDEATRQWLEDLKENDPKMYEKNTPIVEAVAAGEIDLGLVNHYYLYLVKEEQPDAPIANHYLPPAIRARSSASPEPAVLASSDQNDDAERSSSTCSPKTAQRFYVDEARRPSTRWSTGSSRRRACRRSTSSKGPTSTSRPSAPSSRRRVEMLRETGYLT